MTNEKLLASRVVASELGDIKIELLMPELASPDVRVRYRIVGPRINKQSHAMGVDGFQALQLVMEKIGADLRSCPEIEMGRLRWLDRDEPGFPLPEIIADLGWKPGK